MSYFIVGIIGAVIGGILVLTFAPTVLLEKVIPQDDVINDSLKQEEQAVAPKISDVSLTTAIAKKVIPSVVGIRTTVFGEDMLFEKSQVKGIGSGVIVNKEGYVLTNNQVIGDNFSEITVYLEDGRMVPGNVVWTDKDMDLTILKITADNLTAAEMGDSDNIEAGEMAVAIGNPSGLRFGRSVTLGIISALNHSVPVDGEKLMEDLIQTDASINEGNSGGPLINSQCKVIGINTLKAGTDGGMGFAIPINIILPVIKSFVNTGEFKTPYIGITGLDREIAGLYNYKLGNGIYIAEIDMNSPVYNAGIKKDDIILEINSIPINTLVTLRQVIFNAGVGNDVEIKYQDRFGTQKTTVVKLDARQ